MPPAGKPHSFTKRASQGRQAGAADSKQHQQARAAPAPEFLEVESTRLISHLTRETHRQAEWPYGRHPGSAAVAKRRGWEVAGGLGSFAHGG